MLVAGLLACQAVLAFAHAIVLESTPGAGARLDRAPAAVVLRFNSRIEKRLSRVTLEQGRAQGPRQPLAVDPTSGGADRLVIPLPPQGAGSYVVRYRVLSTDGHITEGVLRFTVGP